MFFLYVLLWIIVAYVIWVNLSGVFLERNNLRVFVQQYGADKERLNDEITKLKQYIRQLEDSNKKWEKEFLECNTAKPSTRTKP